MKLLVTLGYFDDSGEGVLLEVDLARARVHTLVRYTPPEPLRVATKGFTGAAWCGRPGASPLLVCGAAAVFRFDPHTWTVADIWHLPGMNDLHHVAVLDERVYVVNTGLEAIDVLTGDGRFVGSHTFHPAALAAARQAGAMPARTEWPAWSDARWPRPDTSAAPEPAATPDSYYASAAALPFHRRKLRDYVHPNHVIRAGAQLLVTCLLDAAVVDVHGWQTVIRDPPGLPHDGVVDGDRFWITCVNGLIDYGIPLPKGSVQAQRALYPGRSIPRGYLEYYGIVQPEPSTMSDQRDVYEEPGGDMTAVVQRSPKGSGHHNNLKADHDTERNKAAQQDRAEQRRLRDQFQPNISTLMGSDARWSPSGQATLRIHGIAVTFIADSVVDNLERDGNASYTPSYAPPDGHREGNKVTAIDPLPPVTLIIQTQYRKGVDPRGPSAYGRGTTDQDRKDGNTSLRFHEGSHGQNFLTYLRSTPPPAFTGQIGMTVTDFKAAQQRYLEHMAAYFRAMEAQSVRQTDCVGTPADFCNSAEEETTRP